MAKAAKPKKKKAKYNITVKTDLTPDQLFNLAIKTPLKNSKIKKN